MKPSSFKILLSLSDFSGVLVRLFLHSSSDTGGESAADLPGKSDAVKIADAMWDYGCDFGANLSAENVYWGNCFGWNSTFEFELLVR